MPALRLVYFALAGHGAAGLRHLLDRNIRPVLVVSDGREPPSAPAMAVFNRRRDALLAGFPDLAELCAREQLPVYRDTPGRPVAELAAAVAAAEPDLGLIVTYFRILPPEVFNLPRHGTYNIHPSLLPAYRGPQPIYWTLRHGASATGVSLHRLDAGIDTGPVFARRQVTVTAGDSFTDLYLRLTTAMTGLLDEFLANYRSYSEPLPVPAGLVPSFFPLPGTADCLIDPENFSARTALDCIRAGNPTLPAFVAGNDFRCLLWRARMIPSLAARSDNFLIVDDNKVFLQFKDGLLEILEYDLLSVPVASRNNT